MRKPISYAILIVLAVNLVVAFFLFSSFGTLGTENEDNNNYRSKPQEISAPRILESIEFAGTTIPLTRFDVRKRFDRELLVFTFMHSTTTALIKRANLYFPIIEPILAEYGVPDDFKFLALIESFFLPTAVSPVGAAGIWQFMPATAREYGLEVSDEVDERLHLEKATRAASRFLLNSYAIFGDWSIVAASFNGGRARLTRQLNVQQADSFYDLFLNDETTRYVYRILAAKEVISNPAKYGFSLRKEDFYHTVRTREVEVTSVPNWSEFAIEHGISYGKLRIFNPWIRGQVLTEQRGRTRMVKIPYLEDLYFDISRVIIHNKNWLSE